MKNNHRPKYGCRIFTLLELLVVIAVIVILASLLLPSLQKAKASAKTIQCSNNLKTIYFAFESYAEEHLDYYPPTTVSSGVEWYDLLYNNGYISGVKPLMVQINARSVTCAALCPAATTIHVNVRTDFTGNGGILSQNADQNRYVKCKRLKIHRPSVTFSFMDGVDSHAVYPGTGPDSTVVGIRHNKGMNLLFFDGHVKWWKWDTLPTGNWGYQNTLEPWCQTGE